MKTTFKLKFLTISIIFLGFAAVANAQNTATATASATVVEGSSVRKDKDLNFGSLIKGNTQGSVHIAPNGQMTYSGITAPSGDSFIVGISVRVQSMAVDSVRWLEFRIQGISTGLYLG